MLLLLLVEQPGNRLVLLPRLSLPVLVLPLPYGFLLVLGGFHQTLPFLELLLLPWREMLIRREQKGKFFPECFGYLHKTVGS